jgi:hypothetical protein
MTRDEIRAVILPVLQRGREDNAWHGEPGDRWVMWLDVGDPRLDVDELADALVAVLVEQLELRGTEDKLQAQVEQLKAHIAEVRPLAEQIIAWAAEHETGPPDQSRNLPPDEVG